MFPSSRLAFSFLMFHFFLISFPFLKWTDMVIFKWFGCPSPSLLNTNILSACISQYLFICINDLVVSLKTRFIFSKKIIVIFPHETNFHFLLLFYIKPSYSMCHFRYWVQRFRFSEICWPTNLWVVSAKLLLLLPTQGYNFLSSTSLPCKKYKKK